VIAVRLMGGLGNQMFQYAAARRLALKLQTQLVVDLGWFHYEGAGAHARRVFELDATRLPAELVSFEPAAVDRWESGRRRFRRARFDVVRQREDDVVLDRRVLDAPDGTLLIGYWQSEGYFADVAETIRRELGFDGEAVRAAPTVEEALGTGRAVSVHIRRGDYVTHPETSAYHGVLTRDYYRQAMDAVTARVGECRFLAFSDDHEWVRQELAGDLGLEVVSADLPRHELALMTRCTHHIVANSSFSWWGAWLGERTDSVVVAPARWFTDARIDTTDVVPARWERI
jgi:hypothetical protein